MYNVGTVPAHKNTSVANPETIKQSLFKVLMPI